MSNKGNENPINIVTEDHESWRFPEFAEGRHRSLDLFWGVVTGILVRFKGIHIGKNCRFIGNPYFNRATKSIITVGDHCIFWSRQTSTFIGLNHRCIVSTLKPEAVIKIGQHCGLSGVSIGAAQKIEIGNHVQIGANTIITDNDWHSDRKYSGSAPVKINDNVWIGVNCVILKGVEIGKNSIIGAYSLVVKSIPENMMAGGNPCKVIKRVNC